MPSSHRDRTLPRRTVAALGLALGAAAQAAVGPPAPAPATTTAGFYQRAAQCAAVLKADVQRRTARPADAQAQRALLVRETEAAFTYVGESYRRGLRKAEADAMLDTATREQAGWRDEQRQTLLQACVAEARQILDAANAIERLLVRRSAKHRVDQLLEPAAPR